MSKLRKTRSEMAGVLELFDQSNQSIKDFCTEQGLNYHTFKYWRDKLAKEKTGSQIGGFRELTPRSLGQVRLMLGRAGEVELGLPGDYPVAALADLLKRLSC